MYGASAQLLISDPLSPHDLSGGITSLPTILLIRLRFATMARAKLAAAMSTYLLIHGAWHGGWRWGKGVPLLEAKGHKRLWPYPVVATTPRDRRTATLILRKHLAEIHGTEWRWSRAVNLSPPGRGSRRHPHKVKYTYRAV